MRVVLLQRQRGAVRRNRPLRTAVVLQRRLHQRAPPDQLTQGLDQALVVAGLQQMLDRGAQPLLLRPVEFGQQIVLRFRQQFAGGALVEHGEAGRDSRLERKAGQQRLAEAVDGLDLQAAGRVEHAGEKAPRRLLLAVRRRAPEEAV